MWISFCVNYAGIADWLFIQVCVFNSVYHNTAWTTIKFSIMSYLTQFCVAYSKMCRLKVPFNCSGIFLLMLITFNIEMCIPRSLASHWDHIFQSVLGHFNFIWELKNISAKIFLQFFSGNWIATIHFYRSSPSVHSSGQRFSLLFY